MAEKIVVYTAFSPKRDYPRSKASLAGVRTLKHKRFLGLDRINSRCVKILPHLFVPDADVSIWTDYNVLLRVPPEELVDMLGDKDVGVFKRTPWAPGKMKTVYIEAEAVAHRDKPYFIRAQMRHYKAAGFDGTPNMYGFLLVRRHTPKVNSLSEAWWAQMCRFSMRDQLSFSYVFGDNAVYWPNGTVKGRCKWYERVPHRRRSK